MPAHPLNVASLLPVKKQQTGKAGDESGVREVKMRGSVLLAHVKSRVALSNSIREIDMLERALRKDMQRKSGQWQPPEGDVWHLLKWVN